VEGSDGTILVNTLLVDGEQGINNGNEIPMQEFRLVVVSYGCAYNARSLLVTTNAKERQSK
jgi:hypothetical protein